MCALSDPSVRLDLVIVMAWSQNMQVEGFGLTSLSTAYFLSRRDRNLLLGRKSFLFEDSTNCKGLSFAGAP